MKFDNYSIINGFCIAAFLFMVSCGGSGQQGQPRSQGVSSYPVVQLQPRSIVLTTSYPATLEGIQTVEIRPRVQGYIEEMRVDEGDVVDKGEVLFRLNNEQYRQQIRSAEADIQAVKAAVSTAENEVKRLSKLAEKEIISEFRLQDAKNNLQSQKAAMAQAQAVLENARINLNYTYIKSPVAGTIGNIPFRIGSLVNSTTVKPLTVVSNISEIYAYFSMSERELLTMSQNVAEKGGNKTLQQRIADIPEVRLLLSDNSTYQHRGTVKLASGLINTETGSALLRAVFPNPEEILRSGATGNVQLPIDKDSVIIIPKKATYEIQNKQFVYTVSDSNTVESVAISVLPLSTKSLYIIQSGLTRGSKIVTAGMGNLKNGTSIKPKLLDADSLYQALTIQDQEKVTRR